MDPKLDARDPLSALATDPLPRIFTPQVESGIGCNNLTNLLSFQRLLFLLNPICPLVFGAAMQSISKLLGQEKRRVYLAWHKKLVLDDPEDEVVLNTSILVTPKEPNKKSHSVDSLTLQLRKASLSDGKSEWVCDIYESPARASALVGLLLVGKISNKVDDRVIYQVAKGVFPSKLESKMSSWHRHDWACAVIDVMIATKILPMLPSGITIADAWQKTYDFLNEYSKDRELGNSSDPIPTCNIHGNEIPSSFDPVTPNPYSIVEQKTK